MCIAICTPLIYHFYYNRERGMYMNRLAFTRRIVTAGIVLGLIAGLVFSGEALAENKRFNMTYMYFGDTQDFIRNVDRAYGAFDMVSPGYFNLHTDGHLLLNDAMDRDFIKAMGERGIRVVPFLSNHWDRARGRAALGNKEKLAGQVAETIIEYGFDGVNIDIENLTEADRESYVEFVRLIRDKLPREKEVSVAVAANAKGINNGWQGSYDYEALARYSDYLIIMAYDEHSEGGVQGPVASISFVEDSIGYALKHVPAEKIVLGIPFYGRCWKAGQKYGGQGVHLNKVQEMLVRFNGRVEFDKHAASPKAVITVGPGSSDYRLFGSSLSPGTYTIWFENEDSIKHKLRLVQKYGLKGAGSWSLGQETADTWEYYGPWLKGNWFIDSYGHWAQSEIADIEKKGWMQGISSTHFAPDSSLTRAQAATVIVRALGLQRNGGTGYFNDVTTNHWAVKEIDTVCEHGLMQGKGRDNFCPEAPLTREEMAVLLERIIGIGEKNMNRGEAFFRDISRGHWSYDAIESMHHQGVFVGYEDGTFRPSENITRGQMAVLMNRIALNIKGY